MNHSLLPRMADEEAPISTEQLPKIVRDSLEAAFQEHQRWLAQWQAQVRALGQTIGRDFEAAVARVRQDAARHEVGQAERVQQLHKLAEDLFQKIEQATVTWRQAAGAPDADMVEACRNLQQALADNSRAVRQWADRNVAISPSDGALACVLDRLTQELARLAAAGHVVGSPAGASQASTIVAIDPVPEPDALPPIEKPGGLFRWLGRPRQRGQ